MKIKKIAIIVLIFVVTLLVFASNVNATITPDEISVGDIKVDEDNKLLQKGAGILNMLVTVGVVVSVVMFMILGMKYMMGSVEERADYKKTMIPMLIGTGLLFTVTTIVGIIGNVVSNLK